MPAEHQDEALGRSQGGYATQSQTSWVRRAGSALSSPVDDLFAIALNSILESPR